MPDLLEEAKRLSDRISALVESAPLITESEFAIDALPLLMEANNELAELVERLEQLTEALSGELGTMRELEELGAAYTRLRKQQQPDYAEYAFYSLPGAREALAAQQRKDEGG